MANNVNPEDFKIDEGIKANSIEDVLMKDENVLITLNPNKKVFILEAVFKGLPIVALWALIDVFIIVQILSSPFGQEQPGGLVAFLIVFFALHLLPVWAYIARIVKRVLGYKNVVYAFTDRRVIIRSGVIGIDFKTIDYSQVVSVNVKVGIFDRLFKVGDLYITAASQVGVLEDIHHPYQYAAKIQKIVTDIKSDMAFPNDLRPNQNKGYQTKYEPEDK